MYFLFLFFLVISKTLSGAAETNREEPIYNPLPNFHSLQAPLLLFEQPVKGYLPVPFRESLEGKWPQTEENFFQDPGVAASERNYARFRQRMINQEMSRARTIPNLIHLIWLGSEPTQAVILAVQSWKNHHPEWTIKLWRDEDVLNFPWTTPHSKEFFEQAANWAEKSDILRFEILYQFGGIYSDTDIICFKSFEDLTTNEISFFAGYESNRVKRLGRPLVGSALIGAKKGHPILLKCMDFSLTVQQAPTTRQYIRSGPGPITKACYEAVESENNEDVIIFPPSFFYPLPWEARLEPALEILTYIRPETYAIHLWEGSWFNTFGPPKHNTEVISILYDLCEIVPNLTTNLFTYKKKTSCQ